MSRAGKLFYLDTDAGGTGCHCKPEWQVYYYNNTGECYEQESPGPCPVGQYFAYNTTSRTTECSCFKNFVYHPSEGTCVELNTRGQCPEGQIVTTGEDGFMKCDCGPSLKAHYWPQTGQCYQHYEQGPCAKGEQFREHPREKRPACIVWGSSSYSSGYKKK